MVATLEQNGNDRGSVYKIKEQSYLYLFKYKSDDWTVLLSLLELNSYENLQKERNVITYEQLKLISNLYRFIFKLNELWFSILLTQFLLII